MSIQKDYLPKHPDIPIYQDDEMFRINTDTEVLGEFIKVYQNDTVLDMGTNNGALLIYANFFKPKRLIGLEINKKALELAQLNLDTNQIVNYELINDNIITYTGEEVDVIICNPPYFKTKVEDHGKNTYKALAKHEDELTIDKLVKSIKRNLRNGGRLFLLFLTSRLDEVLEILRGNDLIVKRMKFVYDINKEFSNVFMVEAVKGGNSGMVVEKPIIIKR